MARQTTGVPGLDDMLGGGLIPGTLTVVLGATGIGKTQLGLQYLHAGKEQEGETGVLFDMTSRGDSQNHADYAQRMFDWTLRERPTDWVAQSDADYWDPKKVRFDTAHPFSQSGRRVTLSDMNTDQLREWKAELNKRLVQTISFFYSNFALGVRRCVIDGIEPSDRASDSFQFEQFEYIYHQILRKEHDWVARDLLRAHFRENLAQVESHPYRYQDVGCLMLCTTHDVMLDSLLSRPIESGDVLSNANTIILMGKIREGTKMSRALCVAKHRGSACNENIREYTIDDHGVRLI